MINEKFQLRPSEAELYRLKLTNAGLKTREVLKSSVERSPADIMLLSGGLDSSILAALDPIPAITVQVQGQGTDIHHAQITAEYLGIPWYAIEISEQQAVDTLPDLVYVHKSFDLAILNDIAVLRGMAYARSLGYDRIRTGDGADMTFCGYQYLWNPRRKEQLIKEYPYMKPASRIIGEELGMLVSTPFMDPEVIRTVLKFDDDVLYNSFPEAQIPGDAMVQKALGLNTADLEAEYSETVVKHLQQTLPQTQHMWGKLALRFAAQGLLPQEIVWRQKTDLQFGSGADNVQKKIAELVTQKEYEALQKDGYILYNKTHAALLKIFKDLELTPPEPKHGEYACKGCRGGIPEERHHCRTCGVYPAH